MSCELTFYPKHKAAWHYQGWSVYLLLRTKLSISHKSFLWQWKVKAVIVFSPKSPVKSLIFHLQEYFQGVTLRFLTWPILLFFASVVKKFETKGGKGGEEFFHKFVLQKKWKNRSSENGDIVPFLVQQGRSVWKKPLAIFYKLVKSVPCLLGRKGVRPSVVRHSVKKFLPMHFLWLCKFSYMCYDHFSLIFRIISHSRQVESTRWNSTSSTPRFVEERIKRLVVLLLLLLKGPKRHPQRWKMSRKCLIINTWFILIVELLNILYLKIHGFCINLT